MRRLRLFVPVESLKSELPGQTQVLPATAELSIKAQDYISIGKKTIEPMLKDPAAAIVVTDDLKMALFAFKEAAEIYEKINAWDDAIFAWSLIQAVPVATELQWDASAKIQQCQRHIQAKQLIPHPPARPAYRSV